MARTRPNRVTPRLWQLEDRATPSVTTFPPTANDDFTDTDGNNPVAVDVLANDAGVGGATLDKTSVTVTTGPQHGTAAVDPVSGAVTYTATGSFMGTDTFKYTVRDSNRQTSAPATVTVVVNRPTANDDSADTDGNNPVTVNVLANDTDPDGNGEIDPTTVKVLGQPAHGTVKVDPATGEVTYTAVGFTTGTDTFTYTVTDKAGAESAPATVSIVVNRPTANPDTANTFGTTPVVIDVLANDTDPDGDGEIDPASVKIVSGPAHGSATIDAATGKITYTPNPGFSGTDIIDYTITDFPGAVSAPGRIRVKVDFTSATQITAVGADAGGGPRVNVLNADGTVKDSFFAYESTFTGGVSVAVGDVNGDGVPDVVTGTGVGGAPLVKVFSGKDLTELASFFAFEESFRGGVNVAVGDVNGDGVADIVAGAGVGGAPRVVVFSAQFVQLGAPPPARSAAISGWTEGRSFFAFEPAFTNGVRVAAGDVNGDGVADIIAGAGVGGGPAVRAFDGKTADLLLSQFVTDPTFTGGVNVAAGDVNGDGIADVITGAGSGGGSRVQIFDVAAGAPIANFFAYPSTFTGGVRVAATDVNQDGRADVLVAPETAGGVAVEAFDGTTLKQIDTLDSFGGFAGGVYVGGHA